MSGLEDGLMQNGQSAVGAEVAEAQGHALDQEPAALPSLEERVLLELLREVQARKNVEDRMDRVEVALGLSNGPSAGTFARCEQPERVSRTHGLKVCGLFLRVDGHGAPVCPVHAGSHRLDFELDLSKLLTDEEGLKVIDFLGIKFDGPPARVSEYLLNLVGEMRKILIRSRG